MKKTALLITLSLSLLTTNSTYAYPPDNAALIYYKYMIDFSKPDDALWDQIADVAKGKIEINEHVRQYLESQQQLIEGLCAASEIPSCDWGLDFSQGLELKVPHLPKIKYFAYIIIAEAHLKLQETQYQDAMDLCLVNLRMAGHVGNDTLISFLVGTAMSALSYNAIGDVLAVISPDAKLLTELLRELERPEYNSLNMKPALLSEERCFTDVIMQITPEKKKLLEEGIDCSEEMKKGLPLLIEGSEEFLAASVEYYRQFFDKYIAAMNQPYKQALITFKELETTPEKDYKAGSKEAFATYLLAPATTKVYDLDIRRQTHQNALKTAIQLYRYDAKKGSLPEKLPGAFPKDLFSGQPFDYEITDTGFILRCRQADTGGKTYEYTFKLPR